MVERVLFVHAHPDDETISTGGTIALLIDSHALVTVLTCTSGERGEVIPDDLRALENNPRALAQHRRAELAEAMAVLGVEDHRYLGGPDARVSGRAQRIYTDSGMQWSHSDTGERTAVAHDEVDETSLTAAQQGEVAADIATVISSVAPDAVVSYGADGGYGHPDHVRVHHATRIAADVMGVPFFAIVGPAVDGRSIIAVDVSTVLSRKRDALRSYRTQLKVTDDTITGPDGVSEPIGTVERFRRVRQPDNSFASNGIAVNILTCVVAVVVGAFAGTTLSAIQPATVNLFGAEVAGGLLVAVAIIAALLIGFRLAFGSRIVAGCAAAGLVAIATVFAATASDEATLAFADTGDYLWLGSAAVVSAVVLAVPRRGRPRHGNIESSS